MKLKLRYYEDKTQVEVNGKWMSLAKAVLHPSVGKEIYKSRDELKEYARKAKELSQIKMLSFTKKIEESYNIYMSSGHASFYVNDKEVERFSDDYVNLYDVKSPSKATLEELKEEFGLAESEMGKIDWVNGTYLANGKPISKEECDFIYSYVNNAEFDTETKRISTPVQPANLLIGDFERRGTWISYEEYKTANIRKLGPNGYYEPKASNEENMRFVSKRNKNLQVIPTKYQIIPDYSFEEYGVRDYFAAINSDKRVGTQFDVGMTFAEEFIVSTVFIAHSPIDKWRIQILKSIHSMSKSCGMTNFLLIVKRLTKIVTRLIWLTWRQELY